MTTLPMGLQAEANMCCIAHAMLCRSRLEAAKGLSSVRAIMEAAQQGLQQAQ